MNALRSSIGIVGLVVACAVSVAPGQVQGQPFSSEVEVTRVEVPVRVIDGSTGEPIRGLSADAFRLFEDSVEQDVVGFFEVHGEKLIGPDVSLGAAPEREIVVLFDLYLLKAPDRDRAVRGLRDALTNGPPPGSKVAIVSFDGSLHLHTQLTSDPGAIEAALTEVEQMPARGLQNRLALLNGLDRGTPSMYREGRRFAYAGYWYELRRQVDVLTTGVRAALTRFAASEARKVAILVSSGFADSSGITLPRREAVGDLYWELSPRFRFGQLLEQTALVSSELGFTLYPVDPTGVSADGLPSADTGTIDQAEAVSGSAYWRDNLRRDNLILAAELTGGQTQFAMDTERAFNAVVTDLDSYYSLAYQPTHRGDGEVHTIEVDVAGVPSSARIVHREAYIDRPPGARNRDRVRAAMLAGDTSNPLGVELELGDPERSLHLGAAKMRRVQVPLQLRIPLAALKLLDRGPVTWGQLTIHILATDADGHQSALNEQAVPVQIDDQNLEKARRQGYFTYEATLQLEGGRHTLHVSVSDELGGTTSTLETDLDV